MKKLAFVVPLLPKAPTNPLECMLLTLLEHLIQKGVALEVLTSCPRPNERLNSKTFYPRGLSYFGKIPVRCFKAAPNRPHILQALSETLRNEGALTAVQETVFLNEMSNSDELIDYIDTHRYIYDLFVFTPFFSAISYFGSTAAGTQAVLMPCLQAMEKVNLPLFAQRYKQTAGMIFLSEQEQAFASTAYGFASGHGKVLGVGAAAQSCNAQRFRAKYGLDDTAFLLHSACKGQEKETQAFVTLFEAYRENHPHTSLKLVLMGGVAPAIPFSCNHAIVNLNLIDAQDQRDAYAAATAFCEPFFHSSFSVTLLESWLAGRPALVNSQCTETKSLVEQSNGGLYFANYCEFSGSVDYLLAHPDKADQMGQNGKNYAQKHFDLDKVAAAYHAYFEEIIAQISPA